MRPGLQISTESHYIQLYQLPTYPMAGTEDRVEFNRVPIIQQVGLPSNGIEQGNKKKEGMVED